MFLKNTPKQLTAIQINSWIDGCTSNLKSAKSNFDAIRNWLYVSIENTEYTKEEREEVMEAMKVIQDLAVELYVSSQDQAPIDNTNNLILDDLK